MVRARLKGDTLGPPKVIEVGVPHQHIVGPLHICYSNAYGRRQRVPVDVGIEENDQIIDDQPIGGYTQPVQRYGHTVPPSSAMG